MRRIPAMKVPFPASPVEGVELAAAGVGVAAFS